MLGLSALKPSLADFWPKQGPQWDALGQTKDGPVLVEAKAHLREFQSPATAASKASRNKINAAMAHTQRALGAAPSADWCDVFYQYTNRIAHLNWLHENSVKAHLVFVSFIGDTEMKGPACPETWRAAFQLANYVLGIRQKHPLHRYIHHVMPDISDLKAW